MTLKTRVATAIATGAVLLNALVPATFASTTTIVVSGNGDSSSNSVSANSTNNVSVAQTNNANITNNVISHASTGGNDAGRNTGGNTSIDTGNATSKVDVTNAANFNQASVANCDCNNSTGVLVSGNGVDSNNNVNVDSKNNVSLGQVNNANLENKIDSSAKTGANDANHNTGGSTSVTTGDAKSDVNVTNNANVNVAQVGNGAGAGQGSNTVLVEGNGDSSNNSVDLDKNNSISLAQTNNSEILNSVYSDAKTGKNDANKNTGGNVTIDTGNATAKANITNEPNFNVVNSDACNCTGDNLFKVAGNGVESESTITADMGNTQSLAQGNNAALDNFALPTAATGKNDANRNTGAVFGIDPVSVSTGDANTESTVTNGGNSNVIGPSTSMDFPGVGNVQFTSDFTGVWTAFLAFMQSHQSV